MSSLAELIGGDTQSEVLQTLLNLLVLDGFPATSWQTLSVPRQFTQAESTYLADLSQSCAAIAQGGYVQLAVQRELDGVDVPGNSWLELIALGFFNLTRNPAQQTSGTYTLSDVGGVGPVSIPTGGLVVSDITKTYLFQSTAPVVVPLNGTATVQIQAEQPGAAYNLGNGSITNFVTSFPGLAGSNVSVSSTTNSWITTQGNDVEDASTFGNRCLNRWSAMSAGGTLGYYEFWSTTGWPEVVRTKIVENFATGINTIIVAGTNGPVSLATFTGVSAQLQSVRGQCIQVACSNALASVGAVPTVAGTLYVSTTADVAATVQLAQNAVVALAASIPIGGTVRWAEIVEAILSVPGTYDYAPSSPLTNTVLATNMVWTPIFNITGSN